MHCTKLIEALEKQHKCNQISIMFNNSNANIYYDKIYSTQANISDSGTY